MSTIVKRKRRGLVIPYYDLFSEKDDLIDEDDYRFVSDILSDLNVRWESQPKDVRKMVVIAEGDKERRVYKLKLPESFYGGLPYLIGTLTSLDRLDLSQSRVTSLPPEIRNLKNLTYLDLSSTICLGTLPKEIGDLASLNKLHLKCAWITSLPPSIGRLKNLTELNLSSTKYLTTLPKEIGDLASLNELHLKCAWITSLPPSIGRLKNLTELNLSGTPNLTTLLEEIGNLIGLTKLSLAATQITSLPPSMGRLKNLQYLFLPINCACPVAKKLCYTVTRNVPPIPSKLWPRVLSIAERSFFDGYSLVRIEIRIGGYRLLRLEKPDCIYQLLVEGRESFVGVLMNRGKVPKQG